MRISVRGDSFTQRLVLLAGVAPTPALEAWGGMALSGVIVAAARLGVLQRLSAGPSESGTIASELGLDPYVTGLLMDCLHSTGHLRKRGSRYLLSRRSRRWLDPASPTSMTRFIEACTDYSPWWTSLPDVARTGRAFRHHDAPPDDAYWTRYIYGQLELARLSAPEVARRMKFSGRPTSILDLGGGHGWYSVALCRRYAGLRSTIIDLPGSARVGREIVSSAGMSDRITFIEGDALTTDLGGPYDAVLCFNVIHHLPAESGPLLFAKIATALRAGGSVHVLDAFAAPANQNDPAIHYGNLFMFLTSGAALHSIDAIGRWAEARGFQGPRQRQIRTLPGLTLCELRRTAAAGSEDHSSSLDERQEQ